MLSMTNPKDAFKEAKNAILSGLSKAIAYHGNIVDLLEYAVDHQVKIDLLSDQTSCHAVYEGGYCPQGLTFDQRTQLLKTNHEEFKSKVNQSLINHYHAIQKIKPKWDLLFRLRKQFFESRL